MGFELRHPSGASTHQWLPSREPAASGSMIRYIGGFLANETAGGLKELVSQVSNPHYEYEFEFIALTQADVDAFITFITNALGEAFDVRENPACGSVTTYTKVKFQKSNYDQGWEIRRKGNSQLNLKIALREVT